MAEGTEALFKKKHKKNKTRIKKSSTKETKIMLLLTGCPLGAPDAKGIPQGVTQNIKKGVMLMYGLWPSA
jgi:hypothetical protein